MIKARAWDELRASSAWPHRKDRRKHGIVQSHLGTYQRASCAKFSTSELAHFIHQAFAHVCNRSTQYSRPNMDWSDRGFAMTSALRRQIQDSGGVGHDSLFAPTQHNTSNTQHLVIPMPSIPPPLTLPWHSPPSRDAPQEKRSPLAPLLSSPSPAHSRRQKPLQQVSVPPRAPHLIRLHVPQSAIRAAPLEDCCCSRFSRVNPPR